jgi:parallel beta-helix repeat protein
VSIRFCHQFGSALLLRQMWVADVQGTCPDFHVRRACAGGLSGRGHVRHRRKIAYAVRSMLSVTALYCAFVAMAPSGWAVATMLYVDQNNGNCSDSGAGTQTQPFCTISAGASKVLAGQTVQVAAGTYTEAPSVGHSGTASSPIVITPAPQASVVITGRVNGIKVSSRSWVTVQGFTITQTTGAGIYVSYSSNVTVSNMTVTQTPGGNGIYVTQSSAITIAGNHVAYAGQPASGYTWQGIAVNATSNSMVVGNEAAHNTDAGIALINGATGIEVKNNVTFANARQYTRAAAGIDVRASGNTIDGNTSYSNEDSGIQFYNGGGNLAYNNVCYNNGDHGIDDLNSPNQVIVANTVYGNTTSGINLEGTAGTSASSGGTVANNVSVNNALHSFGTKGNIRVDANSTAGTSIDYDLVNLDSAGTAFTWGNTRYASLLALQSATGQESHGLEADPLFRYPPTADFQLAEGSPAIDSANSAVTGQPATDRDSNARVDDPLTANTGSGSTPYEDRGAYEFQLPAPGDTPPIAALTVTPSTGAAPLTITADASASTDGDATAIESYEFKFGDGTVVGPQATPTATHTYPCPASGSFTVTVIVIDTAGLDSSATAQVTLPPGNLICNPGFETGTAGWAPSGTGVALTQVAGGHSGDYSAAIANTGTASVDNCTLKDASPHWVATTSSGTYQASIWVRADTAGPTLKLRLREYSLSGGGLQGSQTTVSTLTTGWQQIAFSYTPAAPGTSYLDFNAYTLSSPPGTCFYADDASITLN